MTPTPSNTSLILQAASDIFGISRDELAASGRCADKVTQGRWAVMLAMRQFMNASDSTIAKLLGRERTAINWGIKHLQQDMETYPLLKASVESLLLSLQGQQEPFCPTLEGAEQSMVLSCGCELWRHMPGGHGRGVVKQGTTGIKLCSKHQQPK